MNEGTYFYIVPSSVSDDPNIPDGVALLFGLILGLSDRYGYCYATNDQLASFRRVSVSTVKRWLLQLRKSGYITVEIDPRSNRRIFPMVYPTKRQKSITARIRTEKTPLPSHVEETLDRFWKQIR